MADGLVAAIECQIRYLLHCPLWGGSHSRGWANRRPPSIRRRRCGYGPICAQVAMHSDSDEHHRWHDGIARCWAHLGAGARR